MMCEQIRAPLPEHEVVRAIVDNIPAMLAYWDSSLRCRFANRAYEHWFGVEPAGLIGKHIRELLGPLYELNLPYIRGALRGEAQEFEREIPDPRGGPSRHSLAQYIPDVVDGVVRGFFVHVSDVSAVKRAEIALRESEERFRLTLDEAPIGMALVAPDGHFLRVNHALCDIVGYSAEELTGLTFQAITHLADIGPVLASTLDYDQTLSTIADIVVRDLADFCIVDIVETDNEIRRVKVTSRDPSKAWVCQALTKVPLDRARTHIFSGVLATRQPTFIPRATDELVQALAQSEEHLRLLRALEIRSFVAVPLVANDRLVGALAFVSSSDKRTYGPPDVHLAEELARRAALSIANARLYRAARLATQTRDDVLGIVAHDLRNPLNNIHLQASLLRRDQASTPFVRECADTINEAVLRTNRLISDLLDVTSMEAGRLAVRPWTTKTRDVLAAVAEAQRPLASEASLELVLDVPSDLTDVWADRDRLMQVLENLIGNAIKFTPAGGRIVVAAAPQNGDVLFRVSDTGGGMTEEEVAHAFDRFWQAKKSDRRGAGLGLPIVKGVVEAHGGRILLESAPGKGTSVSFTLPMESGGRRQPE